jgi:hypothetical protein
MVHRPDSVLEVILIGKLEYCFFVVRRLSYLFLQIDDYVLFLLSYFSTTKFHYSNLSALCQTLHLVCWP